MKALIILVSVAITLFIACNTDKTRTFIPGTYVSSGESEYSTASDTLIIDPSENSNFLIHRKTGFRRITEGKLGKQEYEIEEWKAIYDEGTKSLTETRQGKLITFYPDANLLMVGKREYIKIN